MQAETREAYRALVVDDDPKIRKAVGWALKFHDFELHGAGDARQAWDVLGEHPFDAVVLDIDMDGPSDGLELLPRIKRAWPTIEVIMLSGLKRPCDVQDARSDGAYHFLGKPFDPDNLVAVITRAAESARAHRELQGGGGGARLVTESQNRVMRDALRRTARVAAFECPVMLTGETGTGKTELARVVHAQSKRSGGPFVEVDCAELSESVVDSELFGHARGAFTGADIERVGLIEAANGGTLFLDEVGDLPKALQRKLLGVLERGTVRRVGSSKPIPVDFRLVSATKRPLADAVEAGTFRDDLYHRLRVYELALPPLRRRREDIPRLVHHLLARVSAEIGRPTPGIDDAAIARLQRAAWKGNVRELAHVLKRAAVDCEGDCLRREQFRDLDDTDPDGGDGRLGDLVDIAKKRADAVNPVKKMVERFYCENVMRKYDGNISATARHAGMDVSNFKRKLESLGLRPRPTTDPSAEPE